MVNFSPRRTLRIVVVTAATIAALALPASAQASYDLAISQTQSATVIEKGGLVTFTAEVKNKGTEPAENVYAELSSLGGHGRGADDPYQSFSTSQGTCTDKSAAAYGTVYHLIVCELGPLAPGASAKITAVVQANQSAHYFAYLLPTPYEGGYQDADNSDNSASGRVTVSTPPVVTGSKKIKITGLPKGCAAGDFTLRAVAKVRGVKKMKASLFYIVEGNGQTFQKAASGDHLTAKIPVSSLSNELGLFYKLVIKAKQGGGKHLTTTVTFQPC
jgi:FlaG/FlaF family flagellin (archaellin)